MARRPVGRALEMGVAETAVTHARYDRPLTHLGQISEQRFAVFLVSRCPGGHLQHYTTAARAVAVLADASVNVLGLKVLPVTVVHVRVDAIVRLYDYVAAIAPVAAVRSADLDKFLPPERY